jgi:hypothetical protein
MPNTLQPMKLSREEELFLRHWMYDEAHFREGRGPAKKLQLRHQAVPADLAILIAAAIPDLSDQAAAGSGPPPSEAPTWPWTEESLRARVAEAKASLTLNSANPAPSKADRSP